MDIHQYTHCLQCILHEYLNWFLKETLKLKQSFKEISLPLELILPIVKTEVILNMFHYQCSLFLVLIPVHHFFS